jgi:hypothetical protein
MNRIARDLPTTTRHRGYSASDVSYQKLASLLAAGAEIKTIRLSAMTSALRPTDARTTPTSCPLFSAAATS